MDRNLAHKLWVVTRKGEKASFEHRIGELARKAKALGADPEQVCRIVDLNTGNCKPGHNSKGIVIKHTSLARTTGRKATGIDAPRYRVRDHKTRKHVRAEQAFSAFASSVDRQRTYAHISAHYRVGGSVWAQTSGKAKAQLRSILHKADRMASNGEITAALELLSGPR